MAHYVEVVLGTLVGDGQETGPGGIHRVATKAEADALVERGFARHADAPEAPKNQASKGEAKDDKGKRGKSADHGKTAGDGAES